MSNVSRYSRVKKRKKKFYGTLYGTPRHEKVPGGPSSHSSQVAEATPQGVVDETQERPIPLETASTKKLEDVHLLVSPLEAAQGTQHPSALLLVSLSLLMKTGVERWR